MRGEGFIAELRAAVATGVPVICVVTHEEARLKAVLGQAFGTSYVRHWTSTRGIDDDQRLADPVLALKSATRFEEPRVHVFFDLHPFFGDPLVVRALRDFADGARKGHSVLVLVSPSATLPLELDRDVTVLPLPLPTPAALGAIFDTELGSTEGGYSFDREAFVRAALGMTEREAGRAFRLSSVEKETEAALEKIFEAKRGMLRRSTSLEIIPGAAALENVGGLEVLKAWLRARVLGFDKGAKAFGLSEPRGMLVCGVQGCGKSLVSKAAARVLKLPLVRLDFADVFGMPSPEHAMHAALSAIEAISPLVLWVDEVEKGLGGGDARNPRVFGTFLTWLQERKAPVFVAATANDVSKLPPELSRRGRFDDVFFVDLPSQKERADILSIHLGTRGRDGSKFPLDDLAKETEQFSGAELEQVIVGALFRAYAQRRDVIDADIRAAIRETVPLAVLYEEEVQALRTWGKTRARKASADRRALELFGD